jgi:hypothetical protein
LPAKHCKPYLPAAGAASVDDIHATCGVVKVTLGMITGINGCRQNILAAMVASILLGVNSRILLDTSPQAAKLVWCFEKNHLLRYRFVYLFIGIPENDIFISAHVSNY